ncbi:alpha/beta fold hydrolase [Flavobacterium litorale]|uniref:Alpha/beta hydrolase n=1 Tax=Flavobacterium litorale TaxID=2856519 RepID=A0ABX8V923_9FLAO|nr:alpha/beta hydrolase [Flavobacterium litorale]QYJ69335.1 alpha/beta hydrolase [Flavobacterium litorale]
MNCIVETIAGKIEYNVYGNGKPIVFLHGGHSNSQEKLFLKGYNKNCFKLIVPSRPGYGKTPISNKTTHKDAAQLIIALLDVLQIKKCVVVGISAGGLTAIQMAATYPNRVEKLLLISAITQKWLSPEDTLYKMGKIVFSPMVERFTWSVYRLLFSLLPKTMTKVLFKQVSSITNTTITENEICEVKKMVSVQRSKKGFVADLDHDISNDAITKIKCPTLILHSKNDKSVAIAMAHHANTNINNSILKVYNNKWGHLLWLGKDSEAPIADANSFINSENIRYK